jgi:hypothetical protein
MAECRITDHGTVDDVDGWHHSSSHFNISIPAYVLTEPDLQMSAYLGKPAHRT